MWTAAQQARGRWLLFTDADTIHQPGDLRRAMHEAERHKAGVLSYSPRQIVSGFAQRALMPLIFSELALAYPPAKVSDPAQRIAAANGQFLLIEREAYRRLGGHASVADKVLEDVELAFIAKRRRVGLRFRYAADALSARMYRSTGAMIEGWTKNLALLFNNTLATAFWRALDFCAAFRAAGAGVLAVGREAGRAFAGMAGRGMDSGAAVGADAGPVLRARGQIEFSVCRLPACAAGLPLFVALLYRSWFQHRVSEAGKLEGAELRGIIC